MSTCFIVLEAMSVSTLPARIPSSHGYQNGLCFSCDEPLAGELVHVDHVIPRTFLNHDEIWNLVLAHGSCNLEKNARLPARWYLDKLYERNEYYIASNHPIKPHLLAQMGNSPAQRQASLERIYLEAEKVLVHVWEGKTKGDSSRNPLVSLGLMVP